ncbi:MAG: hypothetical protein L0206_06500, partial [Actinobacteria bacterium]|nr:hypothetical protein [Actinomycetota bacterium]
GVTFDNTGKFTVLVSNTFANDLSPDPMLVNDAGADVAVTYTVTDIRTSRRGTTAGTEPFDLTTTPIRWQPQDAVNTIVVLPGQVLNSGIRTNVLTDALRPTDARFPTVFTPDPTPTSPSNIAPTSSLFAVAGVSFQIRVVRVDPFFNNTHDAAGQTVDLETSDGAEMVGAFRTDNGARQFSTNFMGTYTTGGVALVNVLHKRASQSEFVRVIDGGPQPQPGPLASTTYEVDPSATRALAIVLSGQMLNSNRDPLSGAPDIGFEADIPAIVTGTPFPDVDVNDNNTVQEGLRVRAEIYAVDAFGNVNLNEPGVPLDPADPGFVMATSEDHRIRLRSDILFGASLVDPNNGMTLVPQPRLGRRFGTLVSTAPRARSIATVARAGTAVTVTTTQPHGFLR